MESRRKKGRRPSGGGRRRARGRRARPPRSLAGARRVARERFAIATMHPEQEQAVRALLAGRDVLAVLPTGFGKSLVYQVPAVLTPRPTLVVSPLIALMADQEAALKRRGVPVVRIDSSLRAGERREAMARLERGGRLVILSTPETILSEPMRAPLARARPWLLCVDEAHCISEWGHDFRPSYRRLGAEREALGDPVLLALTATATPRVRADVAERLGLRSPLLVAAPPHRPNLRLAASVVEGGGKVARAGELIRRMQRPAIVYCATTVEVDRVWAALSRARIPCARYHGRMGRTEKEAAQRRFMRPGKKLVMVATSAFGMGIDKPDIRTILHYQAPGSVEQYVQEAGRAGRDGKPARCILLLDPADLSIQRHLAARSRTRPEHVRRTVAALEAWSSEGRFPTRDELVLSAGVPRSAGGSVCALLGELGVVEAGADRRLRLACGRSVLAGRSAELVRSLKVREREDAARLDALERYAREPGCRAVSLRRYFGEESPPTCGTCDGCGAAPGAARPGRGSRGSRPRRRRKA